MFSKYLQCMNWSVCMHFNKLNALLEYIEPRCNNYAQCSIREYKPDFSTLLSSSLVWDDHYNSILNKAYKILGLISRIFSTNLIPVKKKLYNSLVRAQLLYFSQVWCPYRIKHLILEQAQRKQQIHSKWLLFLQISTNEITTVAPKVYHDIMFLSNPTNLLPHISTSVITLKFAIATPDLVPSLKWYTKEVPPIFFHNSYFCRLPRLWNSLPSINLSSPTNTIKHKLLHYLWDLFHWEFYWQFTLHPSFLLPLLQMFSHCQTITFHLPQQLTAIPPTINII